MRPRPVRRLEARGDQAERLQEWPFTIPAVRHLLCEGIDFAAAVTILVGENGSGKSTVLEALADAYGLNVEGGSTGAMHRTRPSESGLAEQVQVVRGPGAPRGGFFLRAETMHGFYSYLESVGMGSFHELSHGESFLELIESRCYDNRGRSRPGLYLFDEVESALSFNSTLRVLATLMDLVDNDGIQVVLATHSPVLAALPGATILEFDGNGFHTAHWQDLELVVNERYFLADPQRFLRHL